MLAPRRGAPASDLPPVRIFLGSEPAQRRAERVFVWSIERVRDPGRRYEIHVMKDLAGFSRAALDDRLHAVPLRDPATSPGSGRAIYNDIDQIYRADPGLLVRLRARRLRLPQRRVPTTPR